MKNNFDIKQFLVENKITRNSNVLKESEFKLGPDDYELAKGFNTKFLKVGDIVTPDMWDEEKCNEMGLDYHFFTREPWIIESFEHINEPQMGEVYWLLILKGTRSGEIVDDTEEDIANEILKDNYKFDFPLDVPDRVNEEFELGDEDYELAKGFNVTVLKPGDYITFDMVGPPFNGEELKKHYPFKIDSIYTDMVTLQGNNGVNSAYDINFINDHLLKPEFKVDESLYESFELGPDDYELAKGFDTAPQIQVDVHLIYNWNSDSKAFSSVPDHETTYRLHYNINELVELIDKYSPYETYTADEIPSKLKDKDFIEVLYESLLELAYEELRQPADLWGSHLIEEWIQDKAYKVFNPINWSKFPQDAWNLDEMEVTADLIKPLNESFDLDDENFELGPEDYELAKGFDEFDWVGETYDEFEEWAVPILTKAGFKLDDIKEYMLDMFDYGDMGPYLDVTNKELINDFEAYLENNMNESFELGPDDYEMAKGFSQRKLKVGDYFYDSTNPKFAGAWTKLEDTPSVIRNLVKKIIYIGPNEGQYKEPIYGDDKIMAFEFAINPENVYTLTVDSFNEDFTDIINAYIPTENLDESFELGPDDYELAKEFSIKFLKIGDIITKDMVRDEFSWFSPDTKWQITSIEPSSYGGDIEFLDLKTKRPKGSPVDFFNDEFLKPGYKVELPLGEPVNWDDEDDDDY